MNKLFGPLILALMLLTLTACGDLLGKKVVPKELSTERYKADCELELDAFKNILHQNIKSQILCLGENLNLFIKIVKNDTKPGYMNRAAFEAYLRNHETGITPEMLKALKQVYELNYLIRGEDREYISKENVDEVINLAIVFNEQMAVNFGPIFESEQEATYTLHKIHKQRVGDAANKIMLALLRFFRSERAGRIDTINIVNLLEAFSTKDTEETINKIKKVLFAKKILVGGDNEVLTHVELERFMYSFSYLAQIALDAVRYKYILLDQQSIVSMLRVDVDQLAGIVYNPKLGNRDNELFLTMDNLFETVNMFVPKETFEIDKFKNAVIYGKKIVMGGTSKTIFGADFANLFYHAKNLLETGRLFHQMYDKFRVSLESKLPVSINYNQAITAFPEHPNELKKFIRITQNYRFMKGEFESPFYSRDWRRNPDAVFEIALYEYLLDLVMRFVDPEPSEVEGLNCKAEWGTKFPYAGTTFTHGIDQFQTQCLMGRLEKELIELKLIMPQRAVPIADTISLLGTLFQYQSDEDINPETKKGTPILEPNEATEFAVSLISSIDMAKELMKKYRQACDAEFDDYDRMSPACFRKNFLNFMCEEYQPYFPMLFESIGADVKESKSITGETVRKCTIPNTDYNTAYLDMNIKASRLCMYYEDEHGKPTDEIYYSEGDVMSIIVAMMHVEATVFRWDKNKNNNLDANEVNEAYSIYSWALDGFLVDKPSYIKIFKKQIYQFMVKYEQIPDEKDPKSIAKFVKFLLSPNKKSSATRKTFSSILYGIGEENKKIRIANGQETFKCNWLKDPDHIPTHPDPLPAEKPAAESYAPMLKLVELRGVDASGEPIFDVPKNKCVQEHGVDYCSGDGFDDDVDSPDSKPAKKHCLSILGKTIICL